MTLRLAIEPWGTPSPRKIQQAVEVLHRGGVAAYPTDSIYALGCAIEIATLVLAPGGNFVGKLFQGPDFKKLTEQVRARFETAKTAKPASSRQISIEQYVIGKGFRK